ncbi:EamA family transporter [Bacterioplanoides sp.]|uniref:EamA family transporter n=1 Tax=Bacterioplanoides sp. TaxID=2066072 RepID=UPI003B59FA34
MRTVLLILLTALAPVIWGSTYIVTSEFLPEGVPVTSAAMRVLPAGLLLLLITRVWPQKQQWLKLALLSVLNIGLFQALLFVAAYRLPGGLAAILGAVQPFVVMLLIWWVNHKGPNLVAVIASIASILGMTALILSPGSQWDLIGILAALIGAISVGGGVFLTRHWQMNMPTLAFTGWQLVLGGVMLAPVALLFDAPMPALSQAQILAYVYLSLAGSLTGYFLWFNGIHKLSPVAVSSLGLLSPLSAAVLGWVFLGEALQGVALLGFITVLLSVLIVQWAMLPERPKFPTLFKTIKE